MPVAELLRRISSKEVTEWMAFARLEPIGIDAMYIGFASVAVTIANVNRGKNQKPYKLEDFMPVFGPPKKQTAEEMIQFAQMMTIGLGGKDLRKDK